ncbi:hypothetical protein Vadar_003062 [Vaccinium darrowii]|uniref:Uncharacterized protein n=1 Tax=Vaccinium darrowii TaxID=229202 RepID=A0ACB7X7M1_9ERIC|nr:hypothetical protein Vadar_003062 [Vaccinium darrowii]
MSPPVIKQSPNTPTNVFGRLLIFSGLIVYTIYILSSNHHCCQSSSTLFPNSKHPYDEPYSNSYTPTNITHLVFGISGSSKAWKSRKWYVESWWKPRTTRGFLFLDRTPTESLPWPLTIDPPFRVSENTSKYKEYDRHPVPCAIRMARVIVETFRAQNKNVRWYILSDDDTVFFINNLVEVLGKYDHRKYYYIGTNSERVVSNVGLSFEMGFGGAGVALSYPLAEALAKNLDIDLQGDISGLLSAHPHSPLLSLHHLDGVKPIFPLMNRYESLNHLMVAAKADESRLLQQTVCYHKQSNWTFSISWGYSAHIYETNFPPSILQKPIETFVPWRRGAFPPYMFNARPPSIDPCEAPHVFFFDTEEKTIGGRIVLSYMRKWERKLPACSSSGNRSADHIAKIHVVSPIGRLISGVGSRRECCDVLRVSEMNATVVKLRTCLKDEILA